MDLDLWKKRKKELHLTHDDLAKISGVSRRTIAGIFSGDPRYESPTWNTIQAIERALGINEKNPIMERPLSDIAEDFIREYSDLFSDKTFRAYAELYRMMDTSQRIFAIGMIVGYLKEKGKNININY